MGGHTAASSRTVLSLRNGCTTVDVVPAVGGSIASYRSAIDGQHFDWLRPTSLTAIATGAADGMACFPLIPYSNRVRDGSFAFRGRQIQLPSNGRANPHFEHGHGWRAPWDVETIAPTSIEMRYEHHPDAWPWGYLARQRLVLSETSLHIVLSIENLSAEVMPCGLGLHPYFPRTAQTRLRANVDGMWTTDTEVLPVGHKPCPVASDPTIGVLVDQVPLDNVFTGWDGMVKIVWPERNASLTLEASAPLGCLVVYTPRLEPYFCAEPVSNITDAFNLADAGRNGTGIIVLEPGETAIAQVRLSPHVELSN